MQSIIPAPVRSRRAFTSFAAISTVLISCSSPLSSASVSAAASLAGLLGAARPPRSAAAARGRRSAGGCGSAPAGGLGGRRVRRLAPARRAPRARRFRRGLRRRGGRRRGRRASGSALRGVGDSAARLERRRVGRRAAPAWTRGGGLLRRRPPRRPVRPRLVLGLACLLLGLALGLLLGLALGLLLGLALGARLGLGAGLLLGFLARALLLGAEDRVTLGDDLADRLGDQRAGADRVVVAGDHEVDPVGVAVGVDEADDRDAQALGLFDGDHLGFEVDHEHRVGDALHVLDAAEVRAQLREVGLGGHPLARGQQRELTLGLVAFEVVQAADALVDRLEVGQQAAEPAVVDVGHVGRLGDLLDGVAGLLLGADEQHRAAAVGERRRRTPAPARAAPRS